MKSKKISRIVFAAILAAAIAVATRFTQIPIFGGQGYVHAGDTFILLAAAFLPTPYAVMAAALGGAIADLTAGYAVYVLPTAVIKGLVALLFFGKKGGRLVCKRSVISAIASVFVTPVGYYVAEVIMFGSFAAPLLGVVWNLCQGTVSAILFCVLGKALDAAKFSNISEKIR